MNRVLHVLDHSLPEQSGYAFRSHSILWELHRHGFDVDAISGPKQNPEQNTEHEIDGIRYRRTMLASGRSTSSIAGQIRTIRSINARIAGHLEHFDAGIIHAHSPCLNGLAALGHRRPMIYEMRSSWEDAAVSVGTTRSGSLRYRASRALETYVARRADAVIVICEGLKTELVSRGVAAKEITVVPNALPDEMFVLPNEQDVASVRQRFALDGKKVVGFFGSFFEWEGIDSLILALPDIISKIPDVRLLLAGGGRHEDYLRRLCKQLGVDPYVIFAGRVAHEDVPAFYGAADLMAYPRISDRLTEMVTPLKPLEAMAQRTLVIASNVGGHRELVEDTKTGFLFQAGDRRALTSKLIEVLNALTEMGDVLGRAHDTVDAERRWSVVSRRYLPVYEHVAKQRVTPVGP